MAADCKTCVIVISGDAHDISPKHSKDSSLLMFCVNARPHLIGRTVLNGDFLLVNFIFNEIIFDLDVLGLLGTARSPVSLE